MDQAESKERLVIRLHHWIEHGEEHARELEEWAETTRGMNLENAARQIAGAAARMREADRALQEALTELGAG